MVFSEKLLEWYRQYARDLPWRHTKDPYAIWISEVILQQTRIAQGIIYYYRFLDAFPDVHGLANASEEQVLRCWQGLGYYSRARNLHAAAKQIVKEHGGQMPQTSTALIALKGIGPYTAAAIASIAFNERIPAIDGNVMRILARYFAIEEVVGSSKSNKVFHDTAAQLIPDCRAGDFNQAMMDFGSLVCKPASPACAECMFNMECVAFLSGKVGQYPRRPEKKRPGKRYFHYFVIRTTNEKENTPCFFVKKRTENDIWQHMYEFPMLEDSRELSAAEVLAHARLGSVLPGIALQKISSHPVKVRHQLSHKTIFASFFRVETNATAASELHKRYLCQSLPDLDSLAKPRLIDRFINTHIRGEKSGLFSYLRDSKTNR